MVRVLALLSDNFDNMNCLDMDGKRCHGHKAARSQDNSTRKEILAITMKYKIYSMVNNTSPRWSHISTILYIQFKQELSTRREVNHSHVVVAMDTDRGYYDYNL